MNTPTTVEQPTPAVVVCADCLNVLRGMPEKSVDAVITDPPFGTGFREWDVEPDAEVWAQMQRVCRGPIAIIAYGQNHLRWAQHFAALKAIGFIVWHKYNEPVVSPGLTREHQIVCIWGRSMKQLNAGAVRQPYKSEERMRRFHGKGGLIMERTGKETLDHPDGARCSDVWFIPAELSGFNRNKRMHPNQKPLELMRRLVLLLTAPGEIVCDPYAGSGSTLVAAKQEGRRYVGVEQHKPYANTIETRLAQEMRFGV